MVMLKTSTDTIIELTEALSQFYKSRPTRIEHKWFLHIMAERSILSLFQRIIGKIQDVNTRNDIGVTPLYFAAQEGHFEVCKIILGYVEDKNPARNNGATPIIWRTKIPQVMMVQLHFSWLPKVTTLKSAS